MCDGGHQLGLMFGAYLDLIGNDAMADMGDMTPELVACAALHEGFLKMPLGTWTYSYSTRTSAVKRCEGHGGCNLAHNTCSDLGA